ncbi:MAG: peptide deformylase [Planctomycetota bacterium]
MTAPLQLSLRLYPDPVLLKPAQPVVDFDATLAERAEQMFGIMYAEHGVGLAAPQAGWGARVLVLNPSGDAKDAEEALTLVNPRLIKRWGKATAEEGCLSFPEIFVEVERPAGVRVAWQDLQGQPHERDLNDFPARIVQHELDHLDGVLLVHRMSPVDRIRWRRELEELTARVASAG